MISVIIMVIIGIIVTLISVYDVQEKKKQYSIETIEQYQYFVGKREGKYGIMNQKGEFIIKPQYDDIKIPNPTKDVFFCTQGNESKMINEKQEELFSQYEEIELLRLKNISTDLQYEKSVLTYQKEGKYGLINFEGKELTKPIYEEIDTLQFKEGELLIKQNGKYGVMNINGYVLIKPQYDKIEADGYYTEKEQYRKAGYRICNTTEQGYRYGYLDDHQKQILEPQYNEMKRINEKEEEKDIYLIGAKNGRYGVWKNGEEVIKNDYQSITYDKDKNIFLVSKGKKYGVISIEGKIIIPVEYSQIDITGMYFYAKDFENKIEVFDEQGKQTNLNANTSYLEVANGKYQICIQTIDQKTMYSICQKEQKITKEEYTYLGYLFENYFIACRQDGKLGIIDEQEKVKLPFEYSSIQKVEDKNIIQAVKSEDQITEFYASTMSVLCEMKDPVIEIKEEYIKIQNQVDRQYISNAGEILTIQKIEEKQKIFPQKQGEKWGVVNQEGTTLIGYQYDYITDFNTYGFAGIKQNGKWGVIDQSGTIILEPTYEWNSKEEPNFIGTFYEMSYGFGEIYYTDGK